MKLEALPGGRTKLIAQSVFQSVADRDGMLQGDPSGKHTRGTFAHNQRDVTLPTYDIDQGQRYGWVPQTFSDAVKAKVTERFQKVQSKLIGQKLHH